MLPVFLWLLITFVINVLSIYGYIYSMKKYVACLLLIFTAVSFSVKGQSNDLQEDLSLKYMARVPASHSVKTPVVILLHGYGSNEQDLFGLQHLFPANYIILSARAPFSAGSEGYQWFERQIVNGKFSGRKEDIYQSRERILKFVAEVVKKYKADAANVYLVGFSQGAMMCYETGLTAPGVVKGIGVLSGRLSEPLRASLKPVANRKTLKIFIAHGTADSRIPYSEGKTANEFLIALGLKPEFHTYQGMDHTITNEVMADLLNWLKK